MELYHPLPDFLKSSLAVECTRLVIHKNHRNQSGVLIELYYLAYTFLESHGYYYVFATATFPTPGNLYLKLGMKKHETHAFKYNDLDLNEVSIIYLDLKDPKASQRMFWAYHQKRQQNKSTSYSFDNLTRSKLQQTV
ncbi:hypothetical protein [Scytonema sp. NUACC26]|uniref:hypothetical protein n=1 Tax=Scytonema sp. NUACC26 TaxID=3140176 RepID=UPI0034DCAB92